MQIWRSQQLRCVVVKLNEKVMVLRVAVCEVEEIVEKGLSAAGLRMEDVVLTPAAIALAVLEELEEAEEGKGGTKRDKMKQQQQQQQQQQQKKKKKNKESEDKDDEV